MQQLAIIGREKTLSYAELESQFGEITKLGSDAVVFTSKQSESLGHLGSVTKLGEVFESSSLATNQMISKIIGRIANHFSTTSVNSVDFGISVYGGAMQEKTYKHILIQIKKGLRKQNIKCRFVVPKELELNAAQVKHNKLVGTGIEILIVQVGSDTTLAQTTQIQDIDSYSLRDFSRPNRNMKVGMFPPKLGQIMLSLAGLTPQTTAYDPFCGSGVVLQEAMLRGNTAWGSDNSEEMVRATTENINWLIGQYHLDVPFEVFLGDATAIKKMPAQPFVIVTEGYLGTMMSHEPSLEELGQLELELSQLYLGFLKNLASLKPLPETVVLTIPCWQTKNGLKKLNIIDQIKNLGYTVKQFKSTPSDNLIYKRPNQIVGRQIVVLQPSS